MKIRILLLPVIILIKLVFISSFSGNGNGENFPYEISNCTQLQEMQDEPLANYVLVSDINCSDTINWNDGYGFKPIGNVTNPASVYLEGEGHTVYNLYIKRPDEDYIGLFGYLVTSSGIFNVTLIDANLTGNDNVGGIAGYLEDTEITYCFLSGNINGEEKVGGLVGEIGSDSIVDSSHTFLNIIGKNYTGGLAGYNTGIINNSYSIANASILPGSEGMSLGGLVGRNFGTIVNSYVTGNISGYDYVGGLSGDNGNSDKTVQGYIDNCWASGNISGDDEVGGLVGDNTGIIKNSYSTGLVNSISNGGGLVGQNGDYILNSYSNSSVFTGTEAFSYAGGLVGTCNNDDSFINNSYATGNIYGQNGLGGLVGFVESSCRINNCYSTGDLKGINYVGGFAGYNYGEISESYSSGNISANDNVGGFIGYNEGVINNCFWDINASGQGNSDGGIGKTILEMKNMTTFLDVGWNFVNIWINNNHKNRGYPYLSWQILEDDPDLLHPYFTSIPSDVSIFYQNESLLVQFAGADETNFGNYSVNDTSNFEINQSGFLSNKTSLAVGNYQVNITINDLSGNINWTIFNVGVKEASNTNSTSPLVKKSSGVGRMGGEGSTKKAILKTNQTIQDNQTNQTEEINEGSSIGPGPTQLFDIKLELDSSTIENSDELGAVVTFQSFGDVPTPVNLTYIILANDGEEVYRENGNITVTTEQTVRKNFKTLNLSDGEYTFILTTVYGENVTDSFRQNFLVKSKSSHLRIYLFAGIIFLLLAIVFIAIYSRYRMRLRQEKNENNLSLIQEDIQYENAQ